MKRTYPNDDELVCSAYASGANGQQDDQKIKQIAPVVIMFNVRINQKPGTVILAIKNWFSTGSTRVKITSNHPRLTSNPAVLSASKCMRYK